MSKIGIYAPNANGHRLKYVQYLVSHIPKNNHQIVLLTTPEAIQSDNYAMHLAPLAHCFTPHIISSADIGQLASYAHTLDTALMIDPEGDKFVWKQAWRQGWTGPGAVSALVMRPTGQHSRKVFRFIETQIKRTLMMVANRRKSVNVFQLKSSLWDSSLNDRGVPDPISFDPDQSSLNLLLPPDMYTSNIKWVGVVGALTPRKNIALVLKAAKSVRRNNFGIVLAGQLDPSIRTEIDAEVLHLRQNGIPVVILDSLLTDGQLDAMIELLHCVVLAHSNEGPSGILGKAVEAGTYVVAAGAQSLRADCEGLQYARWSDLTVGEIARSIEFGLDTTGAQPRELHTETLFAERLLQTNSLRFDAC